MNLLGHRLRNPKSATCFWGTFLVFPKCFPLILWTQWLGKIIKRVKTCNLLCWRPGCYHSTSTKQVRGRIFKLTTIHAWVIYQISPNHSVWRARHSEWSENSFIMDVYENIFLKFSQNFVSKARLKNSIIDNHYILDQSEWRALDTRCDFTVNQKIVLIHT